MSFLDNYPGQDVPVLPATPIQNYPQPMQGYQQQPMQMPNQQPDLSHLRNVFNQYMSNQQPQNQNGMVEQILSNRFQPTSGDVGMSIANNAQSFLAPQLFQQMTPAETMAKRYSAELSPYTAMLEAQGKQSNNMMNQAGGATGVLINRYMQEHPGISFADALSAVQAGPALTRMGLQLGPGNSIGVMAGAPQALGAVKQAEGFGSQQGKNVSDLGMVGPIATQKTTAEESTKAQFAPTIAAGTAAGQEAGQAAGKSAGNLQNIIDQTNLAVQEMEGLKNHPSLPYATGMYALAPVIPGTGIQDFVTREDQLKGQVFLQAYNTLKGGGAISDIEGRKAEQAFARLDRHLSGPDYKQALTDLQSILINGMNRVKSQASGGIQIPQMDASQLNAPAMGNIPNPPPPSQLPQSGNNQLPDAQSIVDELRRRGKVQ